MAAVTHEKEIATAIPVAKMFKVFVLEAATIMSKIVPQVIKNVEILEGNGGPGSIIKTTFVEGNTFYNGGMEYKYMKNKIDVIDSENFVYSYTTIEGDPWMESLDRVSYDVKIAASADGGSICKSTISYFPKGDAVIDERQINDDQETMMAMGMFKAVEAYVLAYPDA
ncbi:major allergen Pru ar 1-like [Mercurialis annua]|uniref:major allergen Pru ar 1-like n=1 Tax=Mercurialis annua TaxID=3986 RepID=UPI002160E03A|nr:major allergen Pru ar 1-like [Mercurialis annua]